MASSHPTGALTLALVLFPLLAADARAQQLLEVYDQVTACSCLTLILACIVYWQAREISRLAEGRGAGLPVRPRPAASCQPDRVEERHPLRRNQD